MQTWQSEFLGVGELPREISAFELEAFFTFSAAERRVIEQRRTPALKLGLALQTGFLRMSGRPLDAFRVVPANLWRHLEAQFAVEAPDVASLRAMYRRGRTLFEHQELACETLGFRSLTEHQRRYLVRSLRAEAAHTGDRDRLTLFARRWLYEHRFVILHGRVLRKMVAKAMRHFETTLAASVRASVGQELLERWRAGLADEHGSGTTVQTWVWAAPARHSLRSIEDVLARIEMLYALDVHNKLANVPIAQLHRYAKRLASRAPAAGARIKEPSRTIEVASFLRYSLLAATDNLILMVRRRVADLWRDARASADRGATSWAALYAQLLADLQRIVDDEAVSDAQVRQHVARLLALNEQRRPASRSQIARDRLIEAIRPTRGLLRALVRLPWESDGDHPITDPAWALPVRLLRLARRAHSRSGSGLARGDYWGRS